MKKFNAPIPAAFWLFIPTPLKLKAVIKFLILIILLPAVTCIAPPKALAQGTINFQVFYDHLSPYGSWVDNAQYGYVWVPRISNGFIPYGTNGYWVFTNEGWTWASNYSWGWAPFHYGRWFYDPYYRWVWVPDYDWSPGWVIWRRCEGYYGWAPIEPGISFDIAYSNDYHVPYNRWRFVRDRDFGRNNLSNYYVNSSTYTTIMNKSTVINNFHTDHSRNVRYNAGPDRTEVERRAGREFTPVAIQEINQPGQRLNRGTLQIYKPQMQKNISAEHKPVPSKVEGWRNQPSRQQPIQQPRNQPERQQPVQRPRNEPSSRQQPAQQPRNEPVKQQPVQQQRNGPVQQQPVKQKPIQSQRNNRPIKEND